MSSAAIPFGNYLLLERLAIGGMAEVYLAKSGDPPRGEQYVAVKRILPNIAEDGEFVAMFHDEAKIAGQLHHSNIARIYDVGQIRSIYFIAMEYVPGSDLRSVWDQCRDRGLPLDFICYSVIKLCEGLDYAHRRHDNRGRPLNIIHRDVSPQNVLLSWDGDVKIIDFGIAKAANRAVKTQTGILKGKFAYMAPEQARGEAVDHRVDIFAAGVILYELCTGERLYRADSDFALLDKVRRVDIVPPSQYKPELAGELERIILKALAPKVEQRYPWASVLQSELERFMQTSGLQYGREQLAAFVRTAFAEDFRLEQQRLREYAEVEYHLPAASEVSATDSDAVFTSSRETLPTSDDATMVSASPPETSDQVQRAPSSAASEEMTTELLEDEPAELRRDPTISEVQTASRPRFQSAGLSRVDVRPPGSDEQSEMTQADGQPGEMLQDDDGSDVFSGPVRKPELSARDTPPPAGEPSLNSLDPLAPSERRRTVPEVVARMVEPHELTGARPLVADDYQPVSVTTAPVDRARQGAVGTHGGPPLALGLLALACGSGALVTALLASALWLWLAPKSGHLVVITEPRATEVIVDNVAVGMQTPVKLTLAAGEHAVQLKRPGVDPIDKQVKVVVGEVALLDQLMPAGVAALKLGSDPDKASVKIGGVDKGVTPLDLRDLPADQPFEVELSHRSTVDHKQTITLQAGETRELTVTLPYRTSQVTIKPTPDDAIVYWDKRWRSSGVSIPRVSLESNHLLRVARPGCDAIEQPVVPRGEKELVISPVLTCKKMEDSGTLTVV
ncbi:MAG: serine/threonine protein kinase, partial [Deltaproteobacteria bacterium]|nr:serine/threonine protein kinase [Deltaproteobacteria bacterium]